jgi:AcrR family transcriptional regulator
MEQISRDVYVCNLGGEQQLPAGRAALIVGHPGHELRVHGWLELAQPLVFVLTDGSGRTGQSRLASTTQILTRTGATPGSIYGRLTDGALYNAILEHDFGLFIGLLEELSQALACQAITYVAGDASEHYNPGHEVCRMLINAAVKRVQRLTGRQLANFDFPLIGPPDDCPEQLRQQAIFLQLDEAALARKLAQARNYSAIATDVNAALNELSPTAFRLECLSRRRMSFMASGRWPQAITTACCVTVSILRH